MSETFALSLALTAPAAELEQWLADAPAKAQTVYATGVEPPRDSAAWKLAAEWQSAGKVQLVSARDPDDARRTNWIMQKCASPDDVPLPADSQCKLSREAEAQAAQLLEYLCGRVVRRRHCPSNTQLAVTLELGRGPRARSRVQYLLAVLQRRGDIAIENNGRNAPRVVTVLAEGRAKGRKTRRVAG